MVTEFVTPEDTSLQATFRELVYDQLPHPLPVRETTGMYYGQLRARLFEKFAPKEKRTKGLRPEQLTEPVTSLELGIQENDLWIAAQASEYNLVLATNDKMLRIREVASGLLRIESWIAS